MASAPAAQASSRQSSVFEDDHLLLWSGDAMRARALDQIKALGADTIHATVQWRRVAPAPNAIAKPAFDASDPAAYGNWAPWDALVAGAQARGLKVLWSPTGPAPSWASECRGSAAYRRRCSPRVSDWADFVHAVALRYPTVREWSFWNEPNHAHWLVPQTGKRDGITVNLAAIRYRAMVQAATRALDATGHGSDLILMGETAPLGSSHSTAPVDFYRELLCLDRGYRPFRGVAARARGCDRLPHLQISGVSHHPYTYAGFAKPTNTGRPGDAPIGALGRITRVVDAAARFGIVPKRLPIYLTEFGFQTRPPDPFGVTLGQQARYLNEADWIAYRDPRVASVAQYTLRDDAALNGFNTGLCFTSGKAKPSLAAYELPIWVWRTGRRDGRIWGQVRSAAGQSVRLDIQLRRQRHWVTVATLQTNRRGYFVQRFPNIAGSWRLRYQAHYSRTASAA